MKQLSAENETPDTGLYAISFQCVLLSRLRVPAVPVSYMQKRPNKIDCKPISEGAFRTYPLLDHWLAVVRPQDCFCRCFSEGALLGADDRERPGA